jgi:hypothetical protein
MGRGASQHCACEGASGGSIRPDSESARAPQKGGTASRRAALGVVTDHKGKRFFAVFSGLQATVWRGVPMCQAIRDNPKGIESTSPGLRGTSYPGGMTEKSQTLKGLHLFHKSLICNPFRVVIFLLATQRRPSLNRANAGLRDTIPLGLKNRPLH